MSKKETAEEKLLKIIEASKKAQGSAASAPVAVAVNRSFGFFSLGIAQINYFLIVAVAAGFIYFGREISGGLSLLQEETEITVDTIVPGGERNNLAPQVKGLAYYLDNIKARNIFKPYEKNEAGEQGVATAKAALEKKMKNYKLVGVAWLDVPESATVMIEDLASGVTRFLKEGDKIEDVTVKTIYTDKVVVGHENEEMAIKL